MKTLAELTPSLVLELKYNDLVAIAVVNGIKTKHKKKDLIQEELIALLPHSFTSFKNRKDLEDAGLSVDQIAILIDGNMDLYDATLEEVIAILSRTEEEILSICENIYKLELLAPKIKEETKSDKIRKAYSQGMKLVEIAKKYDAHPSFVFTVVSKEKKKQAAESGFNVAALKIEELALNS